MTPKMHPTHLGTGLCGPTGRVFGSRRPDGFLAASGARVAVSISLNISGQNAFSLCSLDTPPATLDTLWYTMLLHGTVVALQGL